MAETELTREIKRALIGYKPLIGGNLRTIRWAEEVNVGTGYVDVIRFEDYVTKTYGEYFCSKDKCKIEGLNYPNKNCKGCVYKKNGTMKELGIATTCFEIKITKSDFKSQNGHNFVGNFNYYVVPKKLYKEIKDLVPKDIGVILYYGNYSLRRKKMCEFKEIDDRDLSLYLYNAMKKWVDKCSMEYRI